MDLLYLAYYSSLFSLPVIFYILCLKETKSGKKYSRPAWYYQLKRWFARSRVKRLQQECMNALKNVSEEVQEQPKTLLKSSETDSQVIYGADVLGNSFFLKITLKHTLHAEISFEFRLKNGKVYRLPNEPNVLICSVSARQWRAHGFTLQVLEPFRRLRITFNGLLRNIIRNDSEKETGEIEHVNFHLLWNAASDPVYYPQDVDANLLSDAVAREPWRDGEWINSLDSDRGYEQYGALQGFIKGSSFEDDVTFNMPSWRRKRRGYSNALALNRDFFIFSVLKDGTVFAVGAKSLRMGCTQIRYGSVIFSNGQMYTLTDSDITLENMGDHGEIPHAFTVHFKANGKTVRCVAHLRTDKVSYSFNNEARGFESRHVTAECDVDSTQAHAVIEFWYKRQGCGIELPPPLLKEIKTENAKEVFVTSLSSIECRDLSITGGKGNSLALLSSLNSSKFTVPQGFVVTVTAFKHQLKLHPKLQVAVENLENVCLRKLESNIEEICNSTCNLFTNEPVSEKVADLILKEMKNLKNSSRYGELDICSWAVRSSGIGEDSDNLSAAGQNSTFLGCTTEGDVLKAVSACWGSLFTFQSVQYRRQHGLPVKCDMGVVIQRMVPSDSAGVLFTCHPTSGDPSQMVITSNYGLGDSVVSGSADPDTITLSRTWKGEVFIASYNIGTKNIQFALKIEENNIAGIEKRQISEDLAKKLSITEEQAVRLGIVGELLERECGNPRDIEWAFYKNELYLLQSRPITTLNSWTDYELLHEFDKPVLTDEDVLTRANVGEVLKGALTVLTQSSVVRLLDQTMQVAATNEPSLLCVSKVLPCMMHNAFVEVLNMMYLEVQEKITLDTKVLDLAVFGHLVMNEKLHRQAIKRHGVKVGIDRLRTNWVFVKTVWTNKEIFNRAMKLAEALDINFEEDEEPRQMYRKIEEKCPDLKELLGWHLHTSRTSILYQMIAMMVMTENNPELNNDHFHDIALLLATNSSVESAEVPVMLEKISSIIRDQNLAEDFMKVDPKDGLDWLRRKCREASAKLDDFLKAHGHRVDKEFELKELTWGMDPSIIIRIIQLNCTSETTTKKAEGLTVEQTITKLKSPKSQVTRFLLKFIIRKCREAVAMREKTKSELIRTVHKFRMAYRQLAVRMVSLGYIPRADLIFHLTRSELKQVLEERDPVLISKAIRRSRLYEQWNKYTFPEIVYGVPRPEEDDSESLEKIRKSEAGVKVQGTPVYQGNVAARACVIINIKDAVNIKPGDILITYSTDIAWSPYFPMLSGVVTELGGLISHGAVVAREYGLPCIVGAGKATKLFKTGDKVLLSGKTGLVELIL